MSKPNSKIGTFVLANTPGRTLYAKVSDKEFWLIEQTSRQMTKVRLEPADRDALKELL